MFVIFKTSNKDFVSTVKRGDVICNDNEQVNMWNTKNEK